MKAQYVLLINLLFFCKIVFAQQFNSHPIALTPEIKEVFYFNDSIYRASILKRYAEKFKIQSRLYEFTEYVVSNAKEDLGRNFVYTNLAAENKYLKNVIEKTIPKEYLSDNIKVYIVKDPSPNAFCKEDGSIFINIGLLTLLNTEAELASVLSHEYGHYFYMHSLKGFKNYKNAQLTLFISQFLSIYGWIISPFTIAKYFHDSRVMEKQADKMAITFFKKNNYSPSAILNEHKNFMKLEKYYSYKINSTKVRALLRTHPPSKKRLKIMQSAVKTIDKPGTAFFQNDSAMFYKVKQRFTDECIYNYFENQYYSDCIELAYKMHIIYPDDEFYLFFILESLRKKLALFPQQANNFFIIENYKVKPKKGIKKNKNSCSVHYNLKELYGFEDILLENYKKNNLINTDTIEFVTNKQALDYFVKEAELKCKSCYPSLKRMDKKFEQPLRSGNITELQQFLYDQAFFKNTDTNISLKQVVPFFFNNIYISDRGKKKYYKSAINSTNEEYKELEKFLNDKSSEFRSGLDSVFNFFPQLNYREVNTINSVLDIATQKINYENYNSKQRIKKEFIYLKSENTSKTTLSVYNNLPELNLIAKKYGYKKIFFVDFVINRPNYDFYAFNKKNKLDVVIYSIDIENNLLIKYYKRYQFKFTKSSEYSFIFPQIINDLKAINSSN